MSGRSANGNEKLAGFGKDSTMLSKTIDRVSGVRTCGAIILILMSTVVPSSSCLNAEEGVVDEAREIERSLILNRSSFSKAHSGDYSRLSAAEMETYRSDGRYLRSLVQPGTTVYLNLADPRQWRFLMTRLEVAGKNAENSASLFDALAKERADELATNAARALRPLVAEEENQRKEKHYIQTYSANAEEQTGSGAASITYPEGTDYTYVDVGYYDKYGYPLADSAIYEEYGAGTDPALEVGADLTLTSLKKYVVDSVSEERIGEIGAPGTVVLSSYRYETLGSDDEDAGIPTLEVDVEHPADISTPADRKVLICLDRTHQDCDYHQVGLPKYGVRMPFQGEVRITDGDYIIHEEELEAWKDNIARGAVTQYGTINLKMTIDGGACGVLLGSMQDFWQALEVFPDKTGFSWDLASEQWLEFDDTCRMQQEETRLEIAFKVPLIGNNGQTFYTASVSISTDWRVKPDFLLPPIEFKNSCLAAGTMVEMINGEQLPIESIEQGAVVATPYHKAGRGLTIVDKARGFERHAMVRIRDEAGRGLLLTEMHPILVQHWGMTLAKNLVVGDMVMTKGGPSKVVHVERIFYDGKVYNLKLGSQAERLVLGSDETVFYANEFLVGDSQIQVKYERAEVAKSEGKILERLPKDLHRDFLIFAGLSK